MNVLFQTYIILRKEASFQLSREQNVTYFSRRILFSHGTVYHACKKCAVCRGVCRCLNKSKQRKVFGPNDRIIRLFSCAPTKVKLWQTAAAVCMMTFVYLTHSVKLTSHQTLCTIGALRRCWYDVAEAHCICIRWYFEMYSIDNSCELNATASIWHCRSELYLHSFVFLYKSRELKASFYEAAAYLLSIMLRPFSLLDHKLVNSITRDLLLKL